MRKKSGSYQGEKSALSRIFGKFSTKNEDSDWVLFDDLEEESAPATSRKRSRSKHFVRFLAIACLFVSIPLGAKWANDTIFYKNEEFILEKLVVETDGALHETQLLEIANVTRGMNLLELDLATIQGQIERLPQVEKAKVTRELPDRLSIFVHEREALAWISCPPLGIRPWDMERGYLIDSEGILFRCLDLTDGLKALPVIEAFRMEQPVEGEKMTTPGVEAALSLIVSESAASVVNELKIAIVRLKNEWSVECAYRGGMIVTFDIYDVERGLEDLAMILAQTSDFQQKIASVNVVSSKNIPIRFNGDLSDSDLLATKKQGQETVVEAPAKPEDAREKHLQSILKGG